MASRFTDEFSHISSPSTRTYLRRKRDGKCVRCGRVPSPGRHMCIKCGKADAAYARKKNAMPIGEPKPCAWCGKTFRPTRTRKASCSRECGLKLASRLLNENRIIKDEFTYLPVCRQAKKQRRYGKAGVCRVCGRGSIAQTGVTLCMMHRDLSRQYRSRQSAVSPVNVA
jgi:hypothetical protein